MYTVYIYIYGRHIQKDHAYTYTKRSCIYIFWMCLPVSCDSGLLNFQTPPNLRICDSNCKAVRISKP